MANEIEAIYLRDLTNGALFEFLKEMIARAYADTAVSGGAAEELAALQSKFDEYDKVLVLSYKSSQSDKIKTNDRLRDVSYAMFKRSVKAFARIYTGEQLEAAKRIEQLLTDYRINPRDNLRKETGEMTNLNDDLMGRFAPDVDVLGLSDVVKIMTEANNTVSALLVERDNANADRVEGATKAARKECESAYRELIRRVNALALLGSDDYSAFIDSTNEQIEQYRKQVLKRRKRKPKATDNTSGDAEEATPQPAPTPDAEAL